MDSDLLNDREKAAVLWAEHVTKNTARSRDDVYEHVRGIFDDTELVELTIGDHERIGHELVLDPEGGHDLRD